MPLHRATMSFLPMKIKATLNTARLAQSAERKALNLVVVGSSPTVGDSLRACNGSNLRHQPPQRTPNDTHETKTKQEHSKTEMQPLRGAAKASTVVAMDERIEPCLCA